MDAFYCTDIHVPLRMNPNYFGDPLTSHPARQERQNLICPALAKLPAELPSVSVHLKREENVL